MKVKTKVIVFNESEMKTIISALVELGDKYSSQLDYYYELPECEWETYEESCSEILARFNEIFALVEKISRHL